MNHHKSELYFLLFLLFGILILAFFIFKPFLFAVLLSICMATVFSSLHGRILSGVKRPGLAALLSTLAVLIIVIVPLTFVATQILQEATHLYQYLLSEEGSQAFSKTTDNILGRLGNLVSVPASSSLDIQHYSREALNWLLPRLTSFASDVARVILNIFIFLIALYYFFKDGPRLKKAVIRLSPLQDDHDEQIFSKLKLAVNAVVRGNLIIAVIQGAIAAVGFYLFGVPSPILWGSIAAVAAVLPGIGTALIIAPAILFLFIKGETTSALGLFIWGLTAVGLIDNFLGPKLVEKGMRIHPFLILLSVLGGISFFGPLGFLLGPLVLSLLFALSEIYSSIHKEHYTNSL